MISKKVYISRGAGGVQGQFGKSLHFEFFFLMTASLSEYVVMTTPVTQL